jgi:HSP20 family protein
MMMRFDFPWVDEMNRLQNEMDRLFGGRLSARNFQAPGYPPVNLWEDDDNLYVESEIPGMEMDEFELFVNDDNQLTLQGERKQANGTVDARHREERTFGRFSRIIQLPVTVADDATTPNTRRACCESLCQRKRNRSRGESLLPLVDSF